MDGVGAEDARRQIKETIKIWESDMIKDTICLLLLMAFGLAFCTNAVTTEWNVFALMARFGGAG